MTSPNVVRPTPIDVLLSSYEPYVQRCRSTVMTRLRDAPFGHTLVEFFQRGKMLRALLVFIAGAAVGVDPVEVAPAAEAVELLHGASLIHDDIIDDAAERRGLPAFHTQVGVSAALVVGDYLLLRSVAVLGEAHATHPRARVLEALDALSRYGQECCRGQIEELSPWGQSDSEEAYFSLVRSKTGSQFAAAVTTGAILAGGTRADVEALQAYGLSAGTAFQIQDDVLDLVGDSRTLGKPAGKSLAQGRPMLPIIYLHQYGSATTQAAFRRLQQAGCARPTIVDLLEQQGIFARVRTAQERFTAAAQQALGRLQPSPAVDALHAVALFAASRPR